MAKETVKSVAEALGNGTIGTAEAARKIAGLVTRRPANETETERMKRYYEGHHEAAIETDDNSMNHVAVQYHLRNITMDQYKAIQAAVSGETKLSEELEYYLTEEDQPVRKHPDQFAEVFEANGKWNPVRMTDDLVPCTEQEALAAAKKVMGL